MPDPLRSEGDIALMPWPAKLILRAGRLLLPRDPVLSADGAPADAAQVFISRLQSVTGGRATVGAAGQISFEHNERIQDEAYELFVDGSRARILAGTHAGWIRGGETLLQLLGNRGDLPQIEIHDRPRFSWRGVLIDPARHFLPLEVVKRLLDCMAAVKLNVLHWHLSDDQGFRAECRTFPRLQERGSDGYFYRHHEIADVIAHAQRYAIRVVPEFDIPGHTTSWLTGYPHLGSAPGDENGEADGRYELKRGWGPADAALDPTRETTYEFLEMFFSEMTSLFPDECLHIGGDEVLSHAWTVNPRIVAWMKDRGMKQTRDLQVHFNQRIAAMLARLGKRLVGWDEILHERLPESAIVQSWRGAKFLGEALQRHEAIQSNGYYLDQLLPASYHYLVEPAETPDLTEEQLERILGGEACLWGEYIGAENFDSRAWPRLGAVAERLWSPRELRDVDSINHRLKFLSDHLEKVGSRHEKNYRAMLERLAGGKSSALVALQTLAEVVEPIKFYDRAIARLDSVHTPLTRLVDTVRPESEVARRFGVLVNRFCAGDAAPDEVTELRSLLTAWRDHYQALHPAAEHSPLLREVEPISRDLSRAARAALEALDRIAAGNHVEERWWIRNVTLTERAKAPRADLVLVVLPSLRQLIDRPARRG